MSQQFTMPSGMQVTLRPLTVAEENLLVETQKRAQKTSEAQVKRSFIDVMQRCIESIENPVPSTIVKSDGKYDCFQMLQGDMLYLMIGLRVVSFPHGDDYQVTGLQCGACGRKITKTLSLTEDLFLFELDEKVREEILAGEPHKYDFDGVEIEFAPDTLKIADKLDALNEQYVGRGAATGIAHRLTKVGDIASRDFVSWIDGGDGKYTGLTTGQAAKLRDAINDTDCGVDDEVDVVCACGEENTIQIPFGPDFFLPNMTKKRKKKSRVKASSRRTQAPS